MMHYFSYQPELVKRYPSVIGGVILAHGLKNGPTPDELRVRYEAEQQATIARIGSKPLSEIESLAGWRSAFRAFGVDPTQYRSAAEALLRRLTKQGSIPSINTLVDIGNLVSIRYGLPVAIFDTRALQGGVTVHFSDGTERYTPLGEQAVEHPEPGEVVFSDEAKLVIARRWCWRQADQSAACPDTTDAIVTVEAHHADGRKQVEAALGDLKELLQKYASITDSQLEQHILDAAHPSV
ncbi:MAG: B3/B4 domain-containing protein [Aggregatilineales bacterium]